MSGMLGEEAYTLCDKLLTDEIQYSHATLELAYNKLNAERAVLRRARALLFREILDLNLVWWERGKIEHQHFLWAR